MATCKDCLHYGICVFHLKGDENQKCQHYIDDVVPKSEIVWEIFEEIEKALSDNFHADCQMGDCIEDYYDNNLQDDIAELKKKYVPDTNAPNKVSSSDICVVCGEHVPEGRRVCSMCETGKEFFKKRKE